VTRTAQQLRDEIALREASLADAARELNLGELTTEQFLAITGRETALLDLARSELWRLDDPIELLTAPRTRVRRPRWLFVALFCFAVALGLVLFSALSPRQAGNSATGSLSLSTTQQVQQLLTEAEADIANGNTTTALAAYQQVLFLDPKNVIALTQSGWLDFSAGSQAKDAAVVKLGVTNLEKAITFDPRNAGARLYFAIVAASTPGNAVTAKQQFQIFLTLNPSKGQMAIAKPFLHQVGIPGY